MNVNEFAMDSEMRLTPNPSFQRTKAVKPAGTKSPFNSRNESDPLSSLANRIPLAGWLLSAEHSAERRHCAAVPEAQG